MIHADHDPDPDTAAPCASPPPRPARPLRRAAVLAAGGLLTGALAPARADVALTVTQSAATGQATPVPRTARIFLKGDQTRLEVAGGPVLLYDGKAGIVHTLDTARKTYYTTLFDQARQPDIPAATAAPGVRENSKLDLNRTDQTQTLAGVTARRYLVTGTVSYSAAAPSRPAFGGQRGGGRGGGRRRGGGGFPGMPIPLFQDGGGFPGGNGFPRGGSRGGAAPVALPTWSLAGEIWLANSLKLPAKGDGLAFAQLSAASAGPLLAPLADALGKHGTVPLLARVTVTRTGAGHAPSGTTRPRRRPPRSR